MRMLHVSLATLAALASLVLDGARVLADTPLPPIDRPIPTVVDQFIDAKLKDANVKPAASIDDAAFQRRVMLDLVGRIPTVSETKAFLADPADSKTRREKLVDRLMGSAAFVRHQINEFDVLLAGESRSSNLRPYLTMAFKENKPWDQIFRELMVPDETKENQKGASAFLKSRVRDLDRLTNDVSILFFGVNISCAQCHDHPLVADWKQDHFFGMKSFFARTYEAGPFLGERNSGDVQFRTTAGVNKTAVPMFLTGTQVAVPASKGKGTDVKKEKEKDKNVKTPPPAPEFSIRTKFVEVALQPNEANFFAKSIVNRVWGRFFGLGIVTPSDQMHSENHPSHPELLTWLAQNLAAQRYDLRHLIRGLVLSNAYARSSRYEGATSPSPRTFAVGRLRALTPLQLATSLRFAVADPEEFPASLAGDPLERKIEAMENSARGFASLIEQPREDFQISVTEALLFSNNDRIQKEFLAEGKDRLVTRLASLKDPEQIVELAVRNILTREASTEEKKTLSDYLRSRADRHAEACRQLVWALLTSPEFRFNH